MTRQERIDRLTELEEKVRSERVSLGMPPDKFATIAARAIDERDRMRRLMFRIDKALNDHMAYKRGRGFPDEADDALHAAYKRIRRDWWDGNG